MKTNTKVRAMTGLVALLLTGCVDNQTHPDLQPWLPSNAAPAGLGCIPNLDGTLVASELPVALGVTARNRLVFNRPVDLDGGVNGAGQRVWDWGWTAAGETALAVTAEPIASKWYAAEFPGAQFAVAFDVGGYLDGVYAKESDGLYLLGLASRLQNPTQGQTILRYDQPVKTVPLPLQVGATWQAVGKVSNGKLYGMGYAGVDTYESTADLSGRLILPDLSVDQAVRVVTTVTANPVVGQAVVKQQVSFFCECLGEVARAVGNDLLGKGQAQELRRLAL